MTHSHAFRVLAGLVLVCLGMRLAGPMQLQPCRMHSGSATASPGHAKPHSTTNTAAHGAQGSGNGQHKAQECSCLTDCMSGKATASLAAASRAAIVIVRVDTAPAALSAPIPAADFVLPFANGPPATSSHA